jgi:uncharacterized integral membrane protein (TIGR00698 family)
MPVIENVTVRKVLFFIAVALCITPIVTPPVALFLGLIFAQFIGHPYLHLNKKITTNLLQFSVVGLGFGMNLQTAMKAGSEGLAFTIASIAGTLILGALLGKWLAIDRKTSHLISSGTAICGGSAIAAVGPVIQADEENMSVALGIVFILNSIALFLFPPIGHMLDLTQHQFGLWAAIAIHDTSSVVGAATSYGEEALSIATTVKLTRALWIIPLAIGTAMVFKGGQQKIKWPWFIGWFVVATAINTYLPQVQVVSPYFVKAARIGLTLTLFLIGSGLSKKVLRSVGIRPFIQGVILWVVISVSALLSVLYFAQ